MLTIQVFLDDTEYFSQVGFSSSTEITWLTTCAGWGTTSQMLLPDLVPALDIIIVTIVFFWLTWLGWARGSDLTTAVWVGWAALGATLRKLCHHTALVSSQ